jgi:hypothetical protein
MELALTNQPEPTRIEFEVMGFLPGESDYLNWCMQNRYNLEFMKTNKTLTLISTSAVLHIDHLSVIQRIDDALCHKRP